MRVVRFLILLLCFSSSLSLAAFAADLKIKVVDSQGAAVSGAQVSLNYAPTSALVRVVRNTAGEGTVMLRRGTAGEDVRFRFWRRVLRPRRSKFQSSRLSSKLRSP